MTRLILDHFRRWAWVIALVLAFQFYIGWLIAWRPTEPFEFWVFMSSLWMGAILVSFDLQRGMARAVMSLPLTARQIGRGWWLATIPIPAIALAIVVFLGAGTFHYFHPNKVFPIRQLVVASLLALPWLGTTFTAIYGMNNRILFGSWRGRAVNTFFSLLATVCLFGGMLTVNGSAKQPVKLAIYLSVGLFLIIAGWFRAEEFVIGRASFRLPQIPRKMAPGIYRAPTGYGGMPFLISTGFTRAFLLCTLVVGIMALSFFFINRGRVQREDIVILAQMASFMSCWLSVLFVPTMILWPLRQWRTMPIPATVLAADLIVVTVLPLAAFGILLAGIVWPIFGSVPALLVLKDYLLVLAPAAFCVSLILWCGMATAYSNVLGFGVIFIFLLASLWLPHHFHLKELSIGITGSFVALSLFLAWLLAYYMTKNKSRAYRVVTGGQASLFGGGMNSGQ